MRLSHPFLPLPNFQRGAICGPKTKRASLEKAISNLEFHYLASAKIPGRMRKAFAEAIVGIRRQFIQ